MATKNLNRRRVPASGGAERFTLSELNPNYSRQCACGCQPADQEGPFIVFHADAMPVSGRRVKVVVCARCAKKALLQIEGGGEIGIVGPGSLADRAFDGGEPTEPVPVADLRALYETECARVGLLDMPSYHEWLDASGYKGARPDPVVTGVDPNAKSLLQARADTAPVTHGRAGAPVGRTDDPVAQLGDLGNWGHVDENGHFVPGDALKA